MEINKETYWLSSENYNPLISNKKQIVLAGSLRADMRHISYLKKRENGKSKNFPHYSIDRDGTIYQHLDSKYQTDFMITPAINKKSVFIVLANMGWLQHDELSDQYINWCNEICMTSVHKTVWRQREYWERYTPQQYDSLFELLNLLCDEHLIKKDCIGHNVHDSDTIRFDGIVCRSNFDDSYTDLNPAFDFKKLINYFVVKNLENEN